MSRSLSVSQGKGLGRAQARLSAVLEALELHCGERLCPAADRKGSLAALGPDWGRAAADPAIERDWIDGVDLASGRAMPVPRSLVSLDMTGPAPDLPPTSDGMGAGGTRDEARLAGLCELIEREAHARWQARSPSERAATRVMLDSIDDPQASHLIDRIATAGCVVAIHDLSAAFGVAAFLCILREKGPADARRIAPTAGSGCHPDRAVALKRAILEAAQTRVTALAGAREDLSQAHYDDAAGLDLALALDELLAGPSRRSFVDTPDARHADPAAALAALVERLPGPVASIDFAVPVAGVAVVRMIAPWQRGPAIARGPRMALPEAPRGGAGRPLLFVGPTAPALLADPPPGIVIHPPARCGDIAAAVRTRPSAIGLVDGVFGEAPSVWHKELLFAIQAGIPVFGAASLGAIRAAELDAFGMIGVGTVYDAYATGRIARDDAVLVDHAPRALGCRPLGIALVDLCSTLRRSGLAPAITRRLLLAACRLPVPDRNWPTILARAGIDDPALTQRLIHATVSIKLADTQALVRILQAAPPAVVPIAPVPVTRFVAAFSPAPPA